VPDHPRSGRRLGGEWAADREEFAAERVQLVPRRSCREVASEAKHSGRRCFSDVRPDEVGVREDGGAARSAPVAPEARLSQ